MIVSCISYTGKSNGGVSIWKIAIITRGTRSRRGPATLDAREKREPWRMGCDLVIEIVND